MPRLASLLNFGSSKAGTLEAWDTARIFTHGFVSGGYKNSDPWKNTNFTNHYTDATSNLGDNMWGNAAYNDGSFGDFRFHVWGVGDNANQYPANYSLSGAWMFNMTNQSGYAQSSSWNLKSARDDCGTIQDYEHAGAKVYICAGSQAATDVFDMPTDAMLSAGSAANSNGGNWTACCEGQYRGWLKNDAGSQYYVLATNTWNSWTATPQPNTNGWGKSMSSFKGWAYMKDGGNLNSTLCRFDDFTGTNLSTFGVNNAGEENYQQGSDKGYCLGEYNNQQNNNTYKVNFVTDAYNTLSDTPDGHDGMSSASCGTASVLTNAAYGTTVPSY